MTILRLALQTILFVSPWQIRRALLSKIFGFRIDPTARIGFSWINCDQLTMAPQSAIGHLSFIKGARSIDLGSYARIGNLNWITATKSDSFFFSDNPRRDPRLVVGEHAAVTHRHLIDCTDTIEIGSFSTLGGWGSQILTHSIDIYSGKQTAAPVKIGTYTFIGTRVVLLKGATLPDYSVLGAGAVLNDSYEETHCLYAGTPAKPVATIPPDAKYFHREQGFVS